MSGIVKVEVYFDFICPWCLIGKRQLERALALLHAEQPEVLVDVRWRGVQLLPCLPAQGESFTDFYIKRLGSEQAMRLRQAEVQQAAAAAGATLDFSRIARMPNSADAHRLWLQACTLGTPAQTDALLEALFTTHFVRGGNLGDSDTLLGVAEAVGFSPDPLADCLLGDGTPFIGEAAAKASQGVPCFVVDGAFTLSGAQPAERLLAGLRQALAVQPTVKGTAI